MLDELKKISAETGLIIKEDDFPETVCPECLKEAVISYPLNGGKRLRPALLLWTCGLLGGDIRKARRAAAAVEIYHNWTLVHDDLIDNDNMRRGQPSAHAQLAVFAKDKFHIEDGAALKFGADFAILAGDIMQGWAVNMLLKSADDGLSPELVLSLCRRMQEFVNRGLISGEALDVEFPHRAWESLGSEEVERMLRLKTGVLLSFCAEAGGMIAIDSPDWSEPRIAKLSRFAMLAGIAFQLRDDWLGIFGDEEKLGKPVCSDFSESKPTLILIRALEKLCTEERDELKGYIGLKEYSQDAVKRIRELVRNSGAEKEMLDRASAYAAEAGNILRDFPENQYRRFLLELLDFLVGREL